MLSLVIYNAIKLAILAFVASWILKFVVFNYYQWLAIATGV